MSENEVFPVNTDIAKSSWITDEKYKEMYKESIADPEAFWGEHGKRLDWIKPYTKIKDVSYQDNINIKWFHDGILNVCYNCVDRHLKGKAKQNAIIWEGDDPKESRAISYEELFKEICKFSNVLKDQGIKKGDVVTIYMPMIPEAVVAMLACARIGAIHSVVFGGFSPDSLAGRILDCKSNCVITLQMKGLGEARLYL